MNKLIIFCFILAACSTTKKVQVDVDYQVHRIQDGSEGDTEITKMIAPYKEKMEIEMNVVLCYNDEMMEKGKPESTLTNWFVDAIQASTKHHFDQPADFSIQNYGGIRRQSVPKGELTVGTIYEIMPFENQLVILHMKGSLIVEMCNKISKSGGWPVSHNLRFSMQNEEAINITINGKELQDDKVYRVAMPDYVANGGDRLGLPELKREESGILLRDAVLNQLETIDTISPIVLDGRIKRAE